MIKKKKVLREKSTNTRSHYVTNATLLPAVLKAKALGKITDELIKMLWMIAERYSRKSWFINYTYREDMVSAAVLNLCHNNNALKFNPERSSNPFSYYTTAINNVFSQFKHDEKKHRNIKDALLVDAGANPSWNYQDASQKDEEQIEHQTSDDVIIENTPEMTPDDIIVDTSKITEAAEAEQVAISKARHRHPKWAAREPGPVIIYKPSQYTVDPVTNKVTINPLPEPTPKLIKKKAKKKALKKSPRKRK